MRKISTIMTIGLLLPTGMFGALFSSKDIDSKKLPSSVTLASSAIFYVENNPNSSSAPAPTQKAGLSDNTFGTNGVAESMTITSVVGIANMPDGGIVIVGSGSGSRYITRFDKKGSLVTTFGSSGIVTLSTITTALDVVTDSDGNIYAMGSNGSTLIVEKFDSQGTAVSGFTSTALTGSTSTTRGAVLYYNAAIYVLGDNSSNGYLYKINPSTGALDSAFGTSGRLDLGASYDVTVGLAAAGGYVYALGHVNAAITGVKVTKASSSTGALATYGTSGVAAVTLTGASNSLKGIAVDSSGVAYVLGESGSNSYVGKIKADGTGLDTDWATSGILTISSYVGQKIVLDNNNNLAIPGTEAVSASGTIHKIVGEAVDTTFGVAGVFSNSTVSAGFKAIVVTANNDYIATGIDGNPYTQTAKCTNGAAGTAAEQIAANANAGGSGMMG